MTMDLPALDERQVAAPLALAAFEISPMFEKHWSGIPIVTAQIALHCVMDAEIDWIFLYGSVIVPRETVELLLLRRSGAGLDDELIKLAEQEQLIGLAEARKRACIWPNVKSMAGNFAREAFIVHDLSTLLIPAYHHQDSIAHHTHRIVKDCETSEHVFCVSEATRCDVANYLGMPMAKTSVLPLGVQHDEADLFNEVLARDHLDTEPYFLVLGTIEPRKNGRIVIEMLARQPAIARKYRCVFVGRDGWLDEKQRLMNELRDAGVASDRVLFTGFVNDTTKLRLLVNCSFVIYPSFFEGFGLPVLEAAVLGKMCVASNTSSIVEVAPDSCIFFDPTDVDSLVAAVQAASERTSGAGVPQLSFSEMMARIAGKGWDRTYAHIRRWVLGDIQ